MDKGLRGLKFHEVNEALVAGHYFDNPTKNFLRKKDTSGFFATKQCIVTEGDTAYMGYLFLVASCAAWQGSLLISIEGASAGVEPPVFVHLERGQEKGIFRSSIYIEDTITDGYRDFRIEGPEYVRLLYNKDINAYEAVR